jgi:CRISPR-associated protein Cmr6
VTIHGPLRHVLPETEEGLRAGLRQHQAPNADLVLRRLRVEGAAARLEHLQAVADACRHVPQDLLDAVHGRRAAALAALAAGEEAGVVASAVVIKPDWRVVVGHGEDSALETSLTMSPTYGVPAFPATALKGLTAAWARHNKVPKDRIEELFGSPRPEDDPSDARRGSVMFYCALPITPPTVVVDVLTPHVKPYYDQGNTLGAEGDAAAELTEPPAEYHNPVPVRFLAVSGQKFRALLLGPTGDVAPVAEMLCQALDDMGIGGKTAAGYGYCQATIEENLR